MRLACWPATDRGLHMHLLIASRATRRLRVTALGDRRACVAHVDKMDSSAQDEPGAVFQAELLRWEDDGGAIISERRCSPALAADTAYADAA